MRTDDDHFYRTIRPIAGPAVLSYTGLGLQANQFRRLKSGALTIDRTLDLHGVTLPVADAMLHEAIAQAYKRQQRVLLIIHGKGGANGSVIKGLVAQRLQAHACVLAFASAASQDGGTGAVYCLLKRL